MFVSRQFFIFTTYVGNCSVQIDRRYKRIAYQISMGSQNCCGYCTRSSAARSSKADMHAVRIEKGAAAKAKLEAQIKTLQEEARAQRPESDGAGRRQTSEKLEAVAGWIENLRLHYRRATPRKVGH